MATKPTGIKPAKYPEHERLAAIKDQSQIIGAFLEQLQQEALVICEWKDRPFGGGYYPINKKLEQILADYFEIDRDKLENEKQAMLESIRQGRGGE